ncbi:MAG: hypothetical protein M1135_02675 [Candidatus Omnitrophica bacterium]|jgi:Zn finger protein HypA/HybF involved in hydrogenase expression|nr:hypothetical protein [Candidatus Omnitrophota bacterium]
MIKIGYHIAVAIYFFISISILALWSLIEIKRKKEKKFIKEESYLWECPLCLFTYINSSGQEITQCPRCKSFNKKIRLVNNIKKGEL